MMTERNRWIHHIKHLRSDHGVSLLEAERIALADPAWRGWVEHRINTDDRCRRMALDHIRTYGPDALIEADDNWLKVRQPDAVTR
jgi:hypothetical protein